MALQILVNARSMVSCLLEAFRKVICYSYQSTVQYNTWKKLRSNDLCFNVNIPATNQNSHHTNCHVRMVGPMVPTLEFQRAKREKKMPRKANVTLYFLPQRCWFQFDSIRSMEKVVVDMIPIIKDEEDLENITPSTTDNQNVEELRKLFTPDRLKVPKAFKYPPERYRSPTDAMMSPITKGLLARNRKPAAVALLPPSLNNNNHAKTKIQELSVHNDDDLCQT